MNAEDELRNALRRSVEHLPDSPGLDARAAIARSRARRRPKIGAAAGIGALAGVGILAIAIPAILLPVGAPSGVGGGAPAYDQAEVATADDTAEATTPAWCGSPLTDALEGEIAAAPDVPLTATLEAGAPRVGTPWPARVVMTNESAETVTVSLASEPRALMAADGVVVVESMADSSVLGVGGAPSPDGQSATLAPGEFLTIDSAFTVRSCADGTEPATGAAEVFVTVPILVGIGAGEAARDPGVVATEPVVVTIEP